MSNSFDDELIGEFLNEAGEHLEVLENELLAMETNPGNAAESERLNRIFRSVHSIKGTAGFLGFKNIIALSHVMETLFDRFRKGEDRPTEKHLSVLLAGGDMLRRMIDNLAEEATQDVSAEVAAVEALLAGDASPASTPAKESQPAHFGAEPPECEHRYHLEIDDLDAFERLLEITPVRLFKLLESHGFVTASERRPAAPQKPGAALPISIFYASRLSPAELEKATGIPDFYFQSVEGGSQVPADPAANQEAEVPNASTGRRHITFRPSPEILASPASLNGLWKELQNLGGFEVSPDPDAAPAKEYRITLHAEAEEAAIRQCFFFVEKGSQIHISSTPSAFSLPAADTLPAGDAQSPPPAAAIEPSAATPPQAPSGQSAAALNSATAAAADTLRVPAEKLDRLVNLVGEMVILQAQLLATSKTVADTCPDLLGTVEGMERLGAELRDIVLNIRMMPIGNTFGKYQRLVRDLSKQLGKEVRLEIEGGETELDKTVVDQLGDPLVHILRNSLDHGLETPEEREKSGKSRCGTIRLLAQHCGERVLISISDDGRGLNTERIRAKAIERGLISPETRLTEQETWQLIFAPGFSTAAQVTGISGRGVGMDVVKKKIELVGGEVKIETRPGQGTTLILSLPLTLAIIDGLMVEVDTDRLIVPLGLVSETIELTRTQRLENNRRNLVDVRGLPVPYLRLREVFGFPDHDEEIERVVIVEVEGGRLGLVVDRVIGNHQTVLKSLGRLCRDVSIFSGATILGDGHVALVLDVGGLLRSQREPGSSSGALQV